jgi:hypothetical protein
VVGPALTRLTYERQRAEPADPLVRRRRDRSPRRRAFRLGITASIVFFSALGRRGRRGAFFFSAKSLPVGDDFRVSVDDLRTLFPDLPPVSAAFVTEDGVQLWQFAVLDDDDALRWWTRARDAFPHSGLWPLVMDAHEIADMQVEQRRPGDELLRTLPEDQVETRYGAKIRLADNQVPTLQEVGDLGDWPGDEDEINAYRSSLGNSHHPDTPLYLVLVPAADPGHVIEVIRFGGMNGCPPPSVHATIIRRWHHTWGAELFAPRFETLTFNVTRPPATRRAALQLALEHVLYTDIKTEYVSRYAAALLNHTAWSFWWD